MQGSLIGPKAASTAIPVTIMVIMLTHVLKVASSFQVQRPALLSLNRNTINTINTIQRQSLLSSSLQLSSTANKDADTAVISTIENANKITKQDIRYMEKALDAAQKGVGNTYPNPAVGCVLVNTNSDNDQEIIGVGFHPKAGYPHAEIFALFEACGHVESGIDAALSVVQATSVRKKHQQNRQNRQDKMNSSTIDDDNEQDTSSSLKNKVNELSDIYSKSTSSCKEEGANQLFLNAFTKDSESLYQNVTAYVTLEPCCHYGQTPPCAVTFVKAGVNRVVVGFRDPNPRVDGGGVLLLQNEGTDVDLMSVSALKKDSEVVVEEDDEEEDGDDSDDEDVDNIEDDVKENAAKCENIVKAFAKRITPRTEDNGGAEIMNYDKNMNGAKRSALRNLAGQMKKEKTMTEFTWPTYAESITTFDDLEQSIDSLSIDHGWMETIDGVLWEKELILLRLSNAIGKKKGVKLLGERIANDLNAHVAQVVGHTVLLYRPGLPPVLDLEELMAE